MLDQIWTNSLSISVKSGILVDQISDHLPVLINTDLKHTEMVNKPKYTRFFSQYNCRCFIQYLSETDIEPILNTNYSNLTYTLFMNTYSTAFNNFFQLNKLTHHKHKIFGLILILKISFQSKNSVIRNICEQEVLPLKLNIIKKKTFILE